MQQRYRSTIAICFAWLLCLTAVTASTRAADRHTGPWDMQRLTTTPVEAQWGERQGLVQPVYYDSEPYEGQPTQVFAYYGRPEGPGPFPAILLVHGGGGKAFSDWAQHWANRGYVALAMDLSGNGPEGRLARGGPDQGDGTKFRDFQDDEVRDMWTYHAVAAVLRGHTLLAARPEVDADRIGITGISWGGYLTCIIAGIDARLKVAVPVYGCGYLDENSVWLEPRFNKMSDEQRKRWVEYFDPSRYLSGVSCPILFVNGTNDFAYPLDSYQRSYRLVTAPRTLSIKVGLPHGHIWTFQEVDTFVDSVLRDAPALATISEPLQKPSDDVITVSATYSSPVPLSKVELHYTLDTGPWQERKWTSVAGQWDESTIQAALPTQRPLVCFLTATDERNLTVSSQHVELPADSNE